MQRRLFLKAAAAGVALTQAGVAQGGQELTLSGSINETMPIEMNLLVVDGQVTGTYYYLVSGFTLELEGSVVGAHCELRESHGGRHTGTFSGRFLIEASMSYSGTWSSPDGRSYPFLLT